MASAGILGLTVLLMVGTAVIAPAAQADGHEYEDEYPVVVEAYVDRTCAGAAVELLNPTPEDVTFAVDWAPGSGEPAQVVAVPATDWQVVTRLGRLDPQQPVVVSVGGEKIRTFPGSDLWCDGIPATTVSAGGCDEDVAVTLVARASDDEMTYRVVVAGVPTEYVVGPRADRTTTVAAEPGQEVTVLDAAGNVLGSGVVPVCPPKPDPPAAPPVPLPPGAPGTDVPAQPVTPAPVVAAPPVAASAVPVVAVLGTKVAASATGQRSTADHGLRPAAPRLAETGPVETAVLTTMGLLLVLCGSGLVRAGRRHGSSARP